MDSETDSKTPGVCCALCFIWMVLCFALCFTVLPV